MDTTLEQQQPLSPLVQRPRHVHDITDRFSMVNTYVIDDGRLIVVDPGSILTVQLLLAYLQRYLHRSAADIDLIVLTHLHPDHTSGVETLRQACHAPVAASIVAHYLVQKWQGEELHLAEPQATIMNNMLTQAMSQHSRPGILHHQDLFSLSYERQARLVDLWLEDVASLPNHPTWRVIFSPGHTPESLCLYNPFSYELLCGDTAVSVEGEATLVRNGMNRRQLEQTLSILRALKVYYLYPAHGRPLLSHQALLNARVEW
ncbi:MAG TPA: MBL fold metallo-hydrolase [Ktedonobacteraceae bacterium]|nr:MBL fold metallo-hydrolase [Ktedonobacteraceae bacterium]